MRTNSPILIVEDNQVDRMTIERSFKHAKVSNPLVCTSNGEDALAYLRRQGKYSDVTEKRKPCIVLLDLNMPIMGGIEFLKIVKADDQFKGMPVIVLTTSREENDRVESFNLSVAGYIVKPVELEKFTEVIKILDLYWTVSEMPWGDRG